MLVYFSNTWFYRAKKLVLVLVVLQLPLPPWMPHFFHKAYFTMAASSWLKILAFSVGFLHLPRKKMKHARLLQLHGAWLKETPQKMMEKTLKTSPMFKNVQESFATCLPAPQTDGKTKVFKLKNLVFYSQEQKQAFPAGRWHNQRSWPRRSLHQNSDPLCCLPWTDHPAWRTCCRRYHSHLRQRRGNGLTILSIYILLFATCKSTFFVHFLVSTFKWCLAEHECVCVCVFWCLLVVWFWKNYVVYLGYWRIL